MNPRRDLLLARLLEVRRARAAARLAAARVHRDGLVRSLADLADRLDAGALDAGAVDDAGGGELLECIAGGRAELALEADALTADLDVADDALAQRGTELCRVERAREVARDRRLEAARRAANRAMWS